MRKTFFALLTCATLLFTGCVPQELTDTMKEASDAVNKLAEEANEQAEKKESVTTTPAPSVKELTLGKKGTAADWKITVKKAEVKKKIQNGQYRYFKPSKGNKFLVLTMSVYNKGKKEAQFLPRVGYEDTMVQATLFYKEEYEYKPTEMLSYDKDLVTREIQPLSTEKGVVVFEVPNKVVKAKKKLKLRIGTSNDYIVYKLK